MIVFQPRFLVHGSGPDAPQPVSTAGMLRIAGNRRPTLRQRTRPPASETHVGHKLSATEVRFGVGCASTKKVAATEIRKEALKAIEALSSSLEAAQAGCDGNEYGRLHNQVGLIIGQIQMGILEPISVQLLRSRRYSVASAVGGEVSLAGGG